MRFIASFICASAVFLACGCATHRAAIRTSAPVVVSDSVRENLPGDYLRISFLPPNVPVTTLSRPGSLRAFMTATVLYLPPLKLAAMPYYSGLANDDTKVLVAMRCRPTDPAKIDAVLATWPNVFQAIQRDVPLSPGACDAQPADPAMQMACFAKAFTDPPATKVPPALAQTFSYAGTLFDANHTALAAWLKSNYGIYPAFSGMGYSVKDSYSLDSQPMTTQQMLVKSVSSEYILKNVTLAEAGCRCISVASYPGRANDALDPNFIARDGGDGSCKSVTRLPPSHSH
ncbi:MAG TPA: hypothetical protein VFR24_27125 [Candidatus Angelobacter sp.]|nr:hypothetical protein [Candidatus Angelobacter sp.]